MGIPVQLRILALRTRHRLCLILAMGAAATAGAGSASAERLAKEACEALRTEESGLVAAGIKIDMEKGPEWAKANLAAERLQQVARLIEIGEQLSFRCKTIASPAKRRKGKDAKPEQAAAAPDDTAGPAEKPAGKPGKPGALKVKPAKPAPIKPAAAPVKRKPAATAKARKPAPAKQTGLFSFD